MSKGTVRKIFFGAMLAAFSAASFSAPLIINGGFEVTPGTAIGGGGGWKYYDSSQVPGWDGSNIELWTELGITSYEGQNHAELNSHGANDGAWSIFQEFDTIQGQTYDVFFAYGARVGSASASEEAFKVEVDGLNSTLMDHVLMDHVVGSWSTYSGSFIADGSSATLKFTSVNSVYRTYGNFIDDVSVTATPIPGSLTLLTLGLAGLGAVRRKAKAK